MLLGVRKCYKQSIMFTASRFSLVKSCARSRETIVIALISRTERIGEEFDFYFSLYMLHFTNTENLIQKIEYDSGLSL